MKGILRGAKTTTRKLYTRKKNASWESKNAKRFRSVAIERVLISAKKVPSALKMEGKPGETSKGHDIRLKEPRRGL